MSERLVDLVFVTVLVAAGTAFLGVRAALRLPRGTLITALASLVLCHLASAALQVDHLVLTNLLVLATAVVAGALIGTSVVLSFLFQSLRRLGYSEVECFALPVAGLLLALAGAFAVGGLAGVPFIVTPALAFVAGRRWWQGRSGLALTG